MARLCQKAENDANFWRLKYEQDGVAKIEDLEHTKLKLQARLAECESTVDNLSTKLDNLEKSKVKLQTEIESKTLSGFSGMRGIKTQNLKILLVFNFSKL